MTIKLHQPFRFYDLHYPIEPFKNHIEKGNLRKLVILDWLYRFRYSPITVLVRLAGDEDGQQSASQIQKLLNRMEKRQEIRKFPLVTGFTKFGYVLTDFGFLLLQQAQPNRSFTQRVFKEHHKLTPSNFVHDLAIQEQLVGFLYADKHKIGLANEWEVRRYFKAQNFNGKTFDAIFRKTISPDTEEENIVTVGLEVELSEKSNARLKSAIVTADSMIENQEVDYVVYLVPTEGFKRRIEKQIKSLAKSGAIKHGNLFQVKASALLGKIIRGKQL